MPVQVVLDGAIVKNIDTYLNARGLTGHPLFRGTDRTLALAGPWLIFLGRDSAKIEKAVTSTKHIGEGVYWLGEASFDVLFRHLRRLNAARMPDDRIVYFRHYDSDVLAAIAPMLDADQAARLFGPAQVIAFAGGRGDSAIVEKPDGLPQSTAGPIAFKPSQIDRLNERQRVLACEKIALMLRNDKSRRMSDLDEGEICEKAAFYHRSGQELGLTSERAILCWAHLNMETNDAGVRNIALESDLARIPLSLKDDALIKATPLLIKSYWTGRETK